MLKPLKSVKPPRPSDWVNAVFTHFISLYGSQKVSAMWANADTATVKRIWTEHLAGYPPDSILAALDALPHLPIFWPPSLPEFIDLIRETAAANKPAPIPIPLLKAGEVLADPTNPKIIAARAELAAFVAARRMPS